MTTTTIDDAPFIEPSTKERRNYLNDEYGVLSWLLTRDHKRIAILYAFSVTIFFAVGGVIAFLMRLELLTPEGDLFTSDTYNKLFTLHGIVMIFFFLIPAIPAVIGNFILPIMLGAKDLAFPKINLLSWYIYMIGGTFGVYVIITGGVDTGWTFYTPFSTQYSNTHVFAVTLGALITGFSSILTGLNFLVTIHRMRAPGLTWFRLPLFVWSIYATSVVIMLATPVLAITLVLLMVERGLHVGIFDPKLGGDPVLYQHMFWFYSHPAVYIMILPGMAVISECVAAFTRKKIFGYSFVAFSSLAIAFLGFLVWAHHLFVAGISVYSAMIFSFLTMLVAVPSAIKVFNWTATMYKASVSWQTPMLYVLGFIPLHHRRRDRPVPRRARHRRPRPRQLLRRGPFPLHHGRRNDHGLHGRHPLLVAEDHRADVSRMVGAPLSAARLRRLQPDLLPAVHPRLRRHAAPLSRLRAGVP